MQSTTTGQLDDAHSNVMSVVLIIAIVPRLPVCSCPFRSWRSACSPARCRSTFSLCWRWCSSGSRSPALRRDDCRVIRRDWAGARRRSRGRGGCSSRSDPVKSRRRGRIARQTARARSSQHAPWRREEPALKLWEAQSGKSASGRVEPEVAGRCHGPGPSHPVSGPERPPQPELSPDLRSSARLCRV